MDAMTHTLVATGLLFVAYVAGRFVEHWKLTDRLDEAHADHIARFLCKIDAVGIEIDLEEETMIVEYSDGTKEHL